MRTKLVCDCGKEFFRYNIKPERKYACSFECRKRIFQKEDGTFWCPNCKVCKLSDQFRWRKDPRYSNGISRSSYCLDCLKIKIIKWRNNNSDKMKDDKWREKSLTGNKEKALLWYFRRNMSNHRHRSKKIGLPFNITAEYLLELYQKQNGKCYYTNTDLEWNCYGKKNATQKILCQLIDWFQKMDTLKEILFCVHIE